jgi:DNA-binding helix-hairpin-helix protein with protein kinase domain
MQVTLHDNTTVDCADEPFAQGGEGALYFSRDGQHVIKQYLHHDPSRERTLIACLDRYNILAKNPQYWGQRLGWPNAIVRRPWFGMRMYRVQGKMTELAWYLAPKPLLRLASKSPEMLGNWLGRAQIAAEMARIVWELHGSGLCHSDFSGKNFLANAAEGRVALIDCDGLVIPGQLPPRVLGTPEYMAPEIYTSIGSSTGITTPTIETDRHALAVLIYQTLLYRHPLKGPKIHSSDPTEDERLAFGEKALYIEHPSDKSNHPRGPYIPANILGEEIDDLFKKVFVDHLRQDPRGRPLPSSWLAALEHLLDRIVPCSNKKCPCGYFPLLDSTQAKCPWCGSPQQTFSTIPQLQFYRPGASGFYSPMRYQKVVGWKGRTLHIWHVDTTRQRGPLLTAAEEQPIAEFFPHKDEWHIINKGVIDISILDGSGFRSLGAQKGVVLQSNMRILFGSPKEGRIAQVQLRRLP